MDAVKAAIEFANLVGQLKITPRTGWMRRNIVPCESVADHSWRVAILAFLLQSSSSSSNRTSPEYDVGKVIQMALIHDVAECIVGDITPEDNVSQHDKHQLEYNAMLQITKLLRAATINENCTPESRSVSSSVDSSQLQDNVIMKLFQEYEERQTIESIIVKDLDLLDMILQANTYEQQYPPPSTEIDDLSDFFTSTPPSRFQIPQLRHIAEQLHVQRNDRIQKQNQNSDHIGRNGNHFPTTTSLNHKELSHGPAPNNDDTIMDTDPLPNATELLSSTVLSPSDLAFVNEYCTKTLPPPFADQSFATTTTSDETTVIATILALRQWDHQRMNQPPPPPPHSQHEEDRS